MACHEAEAEEVVVDRAVPAAEVVVAAAAAVVASATIVSTKDSAPREVVRHPNEDAVVVLAAVGLEAKEEARHPAVDQQLQEEEEEDQWEGRIVTPVSLDDAILQH